MTPSTTNGASRNPVPPPMAGYDHCYVPTERSTATSPLELLYAEVLTLAVSDLTANDDFVRGDAHSFCFATGGVWADSRCDICDLLGIDEDAFVLACRKLVVDCEPVLTFEELRKTLPDEFSLDEVKSKPQRRIIQGAISAGKLTRTGHQTYRDTKPDEMFEQLKPHIHGKKQIARNCPVPYKPAKYCLRQYVADGRVIKIDGAYFVDEFMYK